MSSWNGVRGQRKRMTPYDAVICCIALDEEAYIDEWIQYHLHIGFSHIYIYDNKDQQLYVNRGFGFLGYPGRVGILPEITLIELV